MQACPWKAHNTFPNFYQKDLTWSNNDNNMYLGPVVAAQEVLGPSPQTSHAQKEKKGAHPLQLSLQESKSQGLGIGLTHPDVWVRCFIFLYILYYVSRTHKGCH